MKVELETQVVMKTVELKRKGRKGSRRGTQKRHYLASFAWTFAPFAF